MTRTGYPRLTINLRKLKHNIDTMVELCKKSGISVIGVVKGFNGIPEGIRQFDESGCTYIASSRMEQLEKARNMGVKKPLMLIRGPMLSEADQVVELTDASLNSELQVLFRLNEEAIKQNKIHGVLLMVDLGDLREGFWDKQELIEAAITVEKQLLGLHLLGIGTTLGCYGSVATTVENMNELSSYAERIEAQIGRRLEIISGGMTKSVPLMMEGRMPARINNLRLGETMILAQELPELYHCSLDFMHQDVFSLSAEIIEVKDKPTYPVGVQAFDGFGQANEYEDRGIRKRALLGVGKLDFSFPEQLIACEEGIRIVGASSDHTILDVEDCQRELHVGDIVTFQFRYATLLYATNSPNIKRQFIE